MSTSTANMFVMHGRLNGAESNYWLRLRGAMHFGGGVQIAVKVTYNALFNYSRTASRTTNDTGNCNRQKTVTVRKENVTRATTC